MTHAPGEPQPAAGGDAPAPSRLVPVGRVGRPHGLDGSFYVTQPLARLLQVGSLLQLAGRAAEVVRRAGTDARPIVRLAGVEDRSAAQALRGEQLALAGEHAPALEPGEWWEHELVGCEVRDGEQLLGTVSRLLALPSCEALEVAPVAGGEPLLVPMVKDAIRAVAPERRRIEVDLEFLGVSRQSGGRA
ncbi:MAG TPA: ribosome maturation factor RimM [Solirubrobacteraceae bacterium]|nr:ribosome maturation factor RimM [Solirubrobacteraceae bacterium]